MNEKLNLDDELVKEGMAYAEKHFLSENSHLELDKAFINSYYDLNGKRVLDFGCGYGRHDVMDGKALQLPYHRY